MQISLANVLVVGLNMIINVEPKEVRIRCMNYPCKRYWLLSTHEKHGKKCPECGFKDQFSVGLRYGAATRELGRVLYDN